MTASQVLAATPQAAPSRYALVLTTEPEAVRAAQRLRHRVFADEPGARLTTDEPGVDVDRFDAFCDHLIVREERTGEVVGTYRMLPPERARAAGSLYAQREFVIDELAPLRRSLVETGRSCVHPDHRTGAVVGLVWAGIARYMLLTGNRWLTGAPACRWPTTARPRPPCGTAHWPGTCRPSRSACGRSSRGTRAGSPVRARW